MELQYPEEGGGVGGGHGGPIQLAQLLEEEGEDMVQGTAASRAHHGVWGGGTWWYPEGHTHSSSHTPKAPTTHLSPPTHTPNAASPSEMEERMYMKTCKRSGRGQEGLGTRTEYLWLQGANEVHMVLCEDLQQTIVRLADLGEVLGWGWRLCVR